MTGASTQPALSLGSASRQGVLLLTGMGLAQALSFARNAVLGHALSPYDFGVAASITLLLQLVDMLSDLGHDRLIVQASDGDDDRFLATAHAIALLRGLLLAAVIYLLAPWAARFFGTPDATNAFALAALVPLIKGAAHLDCRRAQRRLDNRPQMLIEAVPQAIALLATPLALSLVPGFAAVVVLAIVQAIAAVLTARVLTDAPYRIAFDIDVVRRLVAFGWPILLSALPLVAVYQGDRAIVGRIAGLEPLAAYSAAFMLAMVPGLLAARTGHALMLPMFSAALRARQSLGPRFAVMCELTTILAAIYVSGFIIAGGKVLPLAFGSAYTGHEALLGTLAVMWALRMIQAVPGMALMAAGQTKPFLVAGLIRAAALPFALHAAVQGASLAQIAAMGVAGELASLLYVAVRIERLESGLSAVLLTRALFLVPAIGVSLLIASLPGGLAWTAFSVLLTSACLVASGIALMPGVLMRARKLLLRALPKLVVNVP